MESSAVCGLMPVLLALRQSGSNPDWLEALTKVDFPKSILSEYYLDLIFERSISFHCPEVTPSESTACIKTAAFREYLEVLLPPIIPDSVHANLGDESSEFMQIWEREWFALCGKLGADPTRVSVKYRTDHETGFRFYSAIEGEIYLSSLLRAVSIWANQGRECNRLIPSVIQLLVGVDSKLLDLDPTSPSAIWSAILSETLQTDRLAEIIDPLLRTSQLREVEVPVLLDGPIKDQKNHIVHLTIRGFFERSGINEHLDPELVWKELESGLMLVNNNSLDFISNFSLGGDELAKRAKSVELFPTTVKIRPLYFPRFLDWLVHDEGIHLMPAGISGPYEVKVLRDEIAGIVEMDTIFRFCWWPHAWVEREHDGIPRSIVRQCLMNKDVISGFERSSRSKFRYVCKSTTYSRERDYIEFQSKTEYWIVDGPQIVIL